MLYRDGEGCCKIVVEVSYIVLSLSYCLSRYWLIDWFVHCLLIDLLLCHIEPTTSLKRRPTLLCLYKIWATGLGKYSTLYRVIRICTESIQPCYTVIIVFSMELEPSSSVLPSSSSLSSSSSSSSLIPSFLHRRNCRRFDDVGHDVEHDALWLVRLWRCWKFLASWLVRRSKSVGHDGTKSIKGK